MQWPNEKEQMDKDLRCHWNNKLLYWHIPSLFKERASLSGIDVVYEQKVVHGGLLSLNIVLAGGLSTLSLGVTAVERS
jgi:hypothetical protein